MMAGHGLGQFALLDQSDVDRVVRQVTAELQQFGIDAVCIPLQDAEGAGEKFAGAWFRFHRNVVREATRNGVISRWGGSAVVA